MLLRAIVEVSTYDEEVARLWRTLLGRFVDATQRRIEAETDAGRAAVPQPAATAFALCWMTERTLYQQLVQELTVGVPELVEALAAIWERSSTAPAELALARHRLELPRLQAPGHVGVDLRIGGVRARAAHAHRVEAAELQDLEHVDEVDARGEHEETECRHDQRPAEVQVAAWSE